MKMTQAFLLLAAAAMTAQVSFGSEISNPVTRAIWKCKGNGQAYVTSMIITVDPSKNTSSGELYDWSMNAGSAIQLKYEESAYMLGGGVYGHDVRTYSVQLLPSSGYDYLATSTKTQSGGSAVVTYGGFIDCVGDVSGSETLSCDVELERASN